MNKNHRVILTGLSLLEQNIRVHQFSLLVSFFAIVVLVLQLQLITLPIPVLAILLLVIFIGAMELVTSIHIEFDIRLLKTLDASSADITKDLDLMDEILVDLALVNKPLSARDLQVRVKACLALFKRQVILCLIQLLLLSVVLLINI